MAIKGPIKSKDRQAKRFFKKYEKILFNLGRDFVTVIKHKTDEEATGLVKQYDDKWRKIASDVNREQGRKVLKEEAFLDYLKTIKNR